jgi:hypothetical protein
MCCDRLSSTTLSCQAACSSRHPAYSRSTTSGVHGAASGLHSNPIADPALSMLS